MKNNPLPQQARVFPLSRLLLLPETRQQLNIFEPRYRQMVEDSLISDRQFCMAVLEPGTLPAKVARPPIFETACMGTIEECQRNDDGTYLITVRGTVEVQLQAEVETDRAYRIFALKPKKQPSGLRDSTSVALKLELIALLNFLSERAGTEESKNWVESIRLFGLRQLIHHLCLAMPFSVEQQLQLAASDSLAARGYLLLELAAEVLPDLKGEASKVIH